MLFFYEFVYKIPEFIIALGCVTVAVLLITILFPVLDI